MLRVFFDSLVSAKLNEVSSRLRDDWSQKQFDYEVQEGQSIGNDPRNPLAKKMLNRLNELAYEILKRSAKRNGCLSAKVDIKEDLLGIKRCVLIKENKTIYVKHVDVPFDSILHEMTDLANYQDQEQGGHEEWIDEGGLAEANNFDTDLDDYKFADYEIENKFIPKVRTISDSFSLTLNINLLTERNLRTYIKEYIEQKFRDVLFSLKYYWIEQNKNEKLVAKLIKKFEIDLTIDDKRKHRSIRLRDTNGYNVDDFITECLDDTSILEHSRNLYKEFTENIDYEWSKFDKFTKDVFLTIIKIPESLINYYMSLNIVDKEEKTHIVIKKENIVSTCFSSALEKLANNQIKTDEVYLSQDVIGRFKEAVVTLRQSIDMRYSNNISYFDITTAVLCEDDDRPPARFKRNVNRSEYLNFFYTRFALSINGVKEYAEHLLDQEDIIYEDWSDYIESKTQLNTHQEEQPLILNIGSLIFDTRGFAGFLQSTDEDPNKILVDKNNNVILNSIVFKITDDKIEF